MRVDAEAGIGEFGHVGTPDNHRTRRQQTLDDGGMFAGRRRIAQHPRTGQRGFTGDIEQVLDRHRQPVDARTLQPGSPQGIGSARCRQRLLGINLGKNPRSFPRRIGDTTQRRLGQGL